MRKIREVLRLRYELGLSRERIAAACQMGTSTVRHQAKRRRLRTVLQEIMNVAAVLSHHARRFRLRFGVSEGVAVVEIPG